MPLPDHDGLGDCKSREVFHITPSCDVGYSADMCADSGRYVIGGVTGGILKNSMFMRPTLVISSAVALCFGMGLRGGLCAWYNGSNYTHAMECPCTIDIVAIL